MRWLRPHLSSYIWLFSLSELAFAGGMQTVTIAPQMRVESLALLPFSLSEFELSNTEGPSILQTLGWQIPGLSLDLQQESNESDGFSHQRYKVRWHGVKVGGAAIDLYYQDGDLSLLQARLPEGLSFEATSLNGVRAWQSILPAEIALASIRSASLELQVVGDKVQIIWLLQQLTARDELFEVSLDAHSGLLQRREAIGFDLDSGFVYQKNSWEEGDPTLQALPRLIGNGYLDGLEVRVFGSNIRAERPFKMGDDFSLLPATDADLFDQVQAYFTAERALSWFNSALGRPLGSGEVVIFTNTDLGNNARYQPPAGELKPQVHIGRGRAGGFVNLARDSDVLIHELGHHLVYPFLPTTRGESLLLHEGFADYFAYAMNGDPNLAETVVPGQPYLRTALLASDAKFDAVQGVKSPHTLGSYWASVLWRLRLENGAAFDRTVYRSLRYLPAEADVKAAFMALVQADRELQPLAVDSAFGSSYCEIIRFGVERGFSAAVAEFDGDNCNLDLRALHQARVAELEPQAQKSKQLRILGQRCGMVGAVESRSIWRSLIGIPLLTVFFSDRRRRWTSKKF